MKIESFISNLLEKQIIRPYNGGDDNYSHYKFNDGFLGMIYQNITIDDMWVTDKNELYYWNMTEDCETKIDLEKITKNHMFTVLKTEIVIDQDDVVNLF